MNSIFVKCRLIVAQMTSTRCEIFNWIFIPLTTVVAIIALTSINALHEVYLLYFMALLVTLGHVHYGICMVNTITKIQFHRKLIPILFVFLLLILSTGITNIRSFENICFFNYKKTNANGK